MTELGGSARALYDATSSGWVRTAPVTVSDFTGRPPTLALCQPVEGRRVLDLGCGEGYCARELRRMGAAEVLGVDISVAMIAGARAAEEREPQGIVYEVGDATSLPSIPDGRFDLVMGMFVLNYLTIEQTKTALAEVFRVLSPGGRAVMAVPHPALPFVRDPAPPFWFDAGDAGYFSARDQRLPGKIERRDGTSLSVQMCHKTFGDYFDALREAGFSSMPTVRELCVTREILTIDPPFFGPLLDTPLHMAFVAHRES